MTQILITNGNATHPPSKWAMASANMIVDASALHGDRALAAEKLRYAVAEALEPHHATNILSEIERVGRDPRHVLAQHVFDGVNAAVDAVNVVLAASPWAEHFAREDTQGVVHEIIARHFASAQRLERIHYLDNHQTDCHLAEQFHSQTIF